MQYQKRPKLEGFSLRILSLFLSTAVLCGVGSFASLWAKQQTPSIELQATWTRCMASQSWANGQYRYRVMSFWFKNRELHYLDFTVYPSAAVRSNLILGRAQEQNGLLYLKAENQVRVLHQGKKFPTPFRLEYSSSSESKKLNFRIEQNRLQLQEKGKPDTELVNYQSAWTSALRDGNLQQATDLFMLHIYLLQSQLKYFGSMEMTKYRDFVQAGLISGSVKLDFDSRGLLGLGNSGLSFQLHNFEQLAHSQLQGQYFGGALRMEGQLELQLQGQAVFAIDFSKVRIKQGYADSGAYRVRFVRGDRSQLEALIPVTRYGH